MDTLPLLGYFAGIIDGEGSIQAIVARSGSRAVRARGRRFISIAVSVQMTDSEAITLLAARYGGHMGSSIDPRGERGPGFWKRLYRWRVVSQEAAACLTELRPYLLIKQARADVALAIHALNANGNGGRAGFKHKHGLVQEKQGLIRQLYVLNGRTAPPEFEPDTLYVKDSGEVRHAP